MHEESQWQLGAKWEPQGFAEIIRLASTNASAHFTGITFLHIVL